MGPRGSDRRKITTGYRFLAVLAAFLLLHLHNDIASAEAVGEVAATRGDVYLHRVQVVSRTCVEEKILQKDRVETKEKSRAKLDFVDDSTITLSSNTLFDVTRYISAKDVEKGTSIFQLLDGKVKAISGRNSLEIHTPTAVAAARGTYFFIRVRKVEGKAITDIACLCGMVDVRNIDSGIEGTVTIGAGQATTVSTGFPPSAPVPIPPKLLKDVINCAQASPERRQ